MPDILDLTSNPVESVDIKVKYAATPEEHQANVKASIALGLPSLQRGTLTSAPVAVVCSGPSLAQTRRYLRHFSKILTCNSAHDYLLQYGIVPTWQMFGDPRADVASFCRHPHKRVQYLVASSCHPAVFQALKDYDVRVWHVLQEAQHLLTTGHYPKGDWILTGGTNVGMRALVMARLLGYTDIHLFGMDCSAEDSFHATEHPNEPPKSKYRTVRVGDRDYQTTSLFLSYAKQFFHEMLQLPDVHVTTYGNGLLQALIVAKQSDPIQLQDWIDKRNVVLETTIAVVET